jgi:hypothetical protein
MQMSSARRLGRSPVKVHPGQEMRIKKTASRNPQPVQNPFSSAVRRIAGATPNNGIAQPLPVEEDVLSQSSVLSRGDNRSKSRTLKSHSPPSPDCVANTPDDESGGGVAADDKPPSSGGGEPSPKMKTTPGGSPAKPIASLAVKPQIPRLKVVLDMDECLIHSIFNEGIQPGRMPFARPNAPPPSPPPQHVTTQPLESFHLIMLDKAACVVNKRPRIDWFLEQVRGGWEFIIIENALFFLLIPFVFLFFFQACI